MDIKKLPIKIDKLEKIFHLADIHIRLFKRKDEYRQVFRNLYREIRSEKTDNSIIVIAGDIVHSKTEMSPEVVDITADLFTNLADMLPTIIIAGNHDCNLNNPSRLDAISPIVKSLNHKNIHYLKDTGLYEIGDSIFSVLSIFDDVSKYVAASQITTDKTKIAIFHGPINSATTDTGWVISNEKVKTNLFDGFDIVLLGDIHKYQMLQPKSVKKPAIYYPGSLIQQSYGESLDKHGMLIWDVNTREHELRNIKNDFGFLTVKIDNGVVSSELPIDMPTKPRMRLEIRDTTQTQLKECLTDLRSQYKPVEVIINRNNQKNESDTNEDEIDLSNIRDVDFQNKLLGDYLTRNYNLDSDEFDKIYEINKELNEKLPLQEIIRNVSWKPKVFKFSNMFSYGTGNVVDFSKMSGLVGLFSSNATGKTSLLESLMFCLFNKCSKAFKAAHILNNRRDKFSCELLFEIAGEDYVIKRDAKKATAGTVSVKVDFYKILDDGTKFSLNGEQRRDTDSAIRSYIGTYDDFILTAIRSQNDPANFIDKTQSERKDLLSAFMDTIIFDQLYELGSEEMKEYSALLKEYKKNDYESDILEYANKIDKYNDEYAELKSKKDLVSQDKTKLNDSIEVLYKQIIINIDSGILDIGALESNKKLLESNIDNSNKEFGLIESNISNVTIKQTDTSNSVEEHESSDIVNRNKHYNETTIKLQIMENKFEKIKNDVQNKLEKTKKLRQLEYDPECNYCMNNIFVKDAIATKTELENDRKILENIVNERNDIRIELDKISGVKDEFDIYSKLLELSKRIKMELLQLDSKKNALLTKLEHAKNEVEKTSLKIDRYYKSKEDIEKNKLTEQKIKALKSQISELDVELDEAEDELREVHSKVVFLVDKKETAEQSLREFKEMEEKNALYQYYLQAIHRDAIPYELIAKVLPNIETEVNNILSQIVDFAILFDLDGKNINIKMVYDEDRYWSAEMISGMEKFITGLAIRVALLEISNLPRPNFLAIDEGFSSLDAENSANLPMVFAYLKSRFDFIILISHMDFIRDFVDISLDLKQDDGFSKITF